MAYAENRSLNRELQTGIRENSYATDTPDRGGQVGAPSAMLFRAAHSLLAHHKA